MGNLKKLMESRDRERSMEKPNESFFSFQLPLLRSVVNWVRSFLDSSFVGLIWVKIHGW